MKIVITESQYNRFIKSFILKETDEIVYNRILSTVPLTAKRIFKDQNVQKAWDKFKEAEKKFTTMMNSHGSKYRYKFPCNEPSTGYSAKILNACTKSVYDEYNLKNRDLYNMSKYLEWARSFLPSWRAVYPDVYEYQLMTAPEGLGMMRSAYSSCKKAGNYDCSSFMHYYNKIGKNIDSNVYQLSPDELELLKKQWSTLHDIAQAAKSRNPVKVVQSVVKTGVEGAAKVVISTVEQAVAWVKDNFDEFMEGIRSFLMGGVGGIITTIIEFTGIGKIATTIVWAVLAIYDIYNATIGKVDWGKILMSTIGLVTGGVIGKKLGHLLKPFFGAGGSISNFIAKIKNQTWFKVTLGPILTTIQGIASFVGKSVGAGITWLENSVIGSVIPKGIKTAFNDFVKWLEDMGTKLAAALGEGSTVKSTAGQKVVQRKAGEKIVSDLGDEGKNLLYQGAGAGIDYVTGTDYGSYLDLTRRTGKSSDKIGNLNPGQKIKGKNIYDKNQMSSIGNSNLSLADRKELLNRGQSPLATNQVKDFSSNLYKNVSSIDNNVNKAIEGTNKTDNKK